MRQRQCSQLIEKLKRVRVQTLLDAFFAACVLEIRVKTKETFKKVFRDTNNVERDLAASSAL